MTAAVEWSGIPLVASFVVGFVVATIAVLRIVRAVVQLFGQRPPGAPESRDGDGEPPS